MAASFYAPGRFIRDNDHHSLGQPRRSTSSWVTILDSSLTPRHGVAFDNNVERLARPEKDHTNVSWYVCGNVWLVLLSYFPTFLHSYFWTTSCRTGGESGVRTNYWSKQTSFRPKMDNIISSNMIWTSFRPNTRVVMRTVGMMNDDRWWIILLLYYWCMMLRSGRTFAFTATLFERNGVEWGCSLLLTNRGTNAALAEWGCFYCGLKSGIITIITFNIFNESIPPSHVAHLLLLQNVWKWQWLAHLKRNDEVYRMVMVQGLIGPLIVV